MIKTKRVFLAALMIAAMLVASMPVAGFAAGALDVTILHANDTHAHLEEWSYYGEPINGGIARMYTAAEQVRSEVDNVLFLHAGDSFQGTLYFNQWQGEEEAYFWGKLGIDAMVIGNHEFDSGPGTLRSFINGAEFPVISANVDASAEPELSGVIEPYIVKEFGEAKVGIFGLTTPETAYISNAGANVKFNDEVETAKAMVAELEGMGINKIVALTHSGYSADKNLAGAVDGIDVIVGGHSHTPLGPMGDAVGEYPTVVSSPNGGQVLIVHDAEWGGWLGRLDVSFDEAGVVTSYNGAPIHLDESVEPNAEILQDVERFGAPIEALKNTVVGEATVLLNGAREDVRAKETNLADLICDAMLWKTSSQGTQLCITNGGGIRASIDPGNITMGDVLTVLPFGNQIATFGLKGADVWAALEHGVSKVEEGAGQFPQVGGMKYTYNPNNAAGSRILSVEVKNADGTFSPIDPDAMYKVTSNNFMRGGGDGYDMLANNAVDPYDAGAVLADAVAEYIEMNSPISVETDGRITIAEGEAPAAPAATAEEAAPATLPTTGGSNNSSLAWIIAMVWISGGFVFFIAALKRRETPA